MDVLEFVKERQRMHHFYYDPEIGYCSDKCPARGIQCINLERLDKEDIESLIKVVEAWSKENPRKTRQSIFLEQYPNAKCVDGNIYLCPKMIDTCLSCPIDCNDEFDCFVCKREFWSQEVE